MRIGFNNRDIKSDDEELILINMLSGEKVQFYVEKEEFNGGLNDAREYIRNFGSNNLDVDDYFQGLSKKCRYYLRKAQSDIKKFNQDSYLKVISGPIKDEKLFKDMMLIYTNRESVRKKRRVDFIAFFKHRYLSAPTWAIKNLSTQYTFCFYINGELAAFMTGFATNFREIVFPILAMNGNYAQYTPGKPTTPHTIEYLQERTSIRSIDLSRGEETYKIVLGGIKHYNYRFNLEL